LSVGSPTSQNALPIIPGRPRIPTGGFLLIWEARRAMDLQLTTAVMSTGK